MKNITKKRIKYLMNPHTGSVASYEEWKKEDDEAREKGYPEDEGFAEGDFDDLVEVRWDEEEEYWVEVK